MNSVATLPSHRNFSAIAFMDCATTPEASTLPNQDVAHWNKSLMLAFQAELEKNPEADLLSMFPPLYHGRHQNLQCRGVSWAAKINLRTLHELEDKISKEPELNILSEIPSNYNQRIKMAAKPLPSVKKPITIVQRDFRVRLDSAKTAKIIFPLSGEVSALIAQSTEGPLKERSLEQENRLATDEAVPSSENCPSGTEFMSKKAIRQGNALAASLKHLLWRSPKLWELSVRGVVKCSENIVAKVVIGDCDYTEYTSMAFLAQQMPSIPAPRGHGLIALDQFQVIFMSFIPGITLTKAWPTLSHEGKLSVQNQLENIFSRLRSLRQDDGKNLGGTSGEGAKELRIDEFALFKGITSAAGFSDLQFSARHRASETYAKLLRSFVEYNAGNLTRGSVFTHGDVRTDNIMVEENANRRGHYLVTGVIDWEDSGFYPEYFESTTLTRTMYATEENDWFNYLPQCISPLSFPIRWLVDRLWAIHLKT